MELSTLKFVVETKQLEDAATKIKELAVEVSKLNKPVTDAALKSEKLAQAQAKTARETAKLEEANTKTAIAAERLAKAQKVNTTAANAGNAIAERQTEILKFQTEGYSKGQAATLAAAKAAGAYDDVLVQLGVTLKDQRILMGGQPFDNSIGLMQKLENETRISTEVNNLFNKSLGLTEKQMIDLAREHERLIKKYELEGKSLSGVTAEYDELIRKSVMLTQTNDARTNSMKAQIKAQNDTAKANEYIAKELERVNRLTESNGDITSATNNRLIRFEKELRASGRTAAEVASKMDTYRASLLATQKAAGNRQIDYLSRALGPQITDIFVGLATGQSPMMVLLQQGGQLRDQFGLAGIAAKDMGDMLTKATMGMASSVKDVAIAVGSALGGAFIASGKSVNKFIGDITGVSSVLENLRYQIALMQGSDGDLMKLFKSSAVAIQILTGVILAGAIAALIAYGFALKQVIAEESALSKSLVLTGASLGLTRDSALGLSQELAGSAGNVGSYVTAITEIAKAGNITSDNLKTVASTIVTVSKVLGVSSEQLSKNFSKISEKPLEALIPFAKELGTINAATLEQIRTLEAAGKQTEASKVAIEAYAEALKGAAATVRKEMSGFETIFYEIGSAAKSMWNAILNVGRKGDLRGQMNEAVASLIEARNGKAWYSRFGRTNQEEIAYYESIVQSIGLQINAEKKLGDTKAENVEMTEILGRVNKQRQDVLSNEEKRNREIRKAREDHAILIEKGLMKQIESEKILNNIRDKYKDPAKPKEKTALDFYESTLLSITKLTNTSVVSQYELNKAQLKMLEVIDDPRFQKQPLIKQQEILQRLANASVILDEAEALEELRKQNIKVTEEYIKQQQVKDELGIAAFDNSVALNKAVKEESDELMFQATLIGKTDEQRKKAIKTRQSELTLAKELRDIEDLKELGFGVTKESLREAANQRFLERAKNINTEIAIDAATKTLEEYNKIADGITDSIVTALIDGGKAGGKKLRAIIEAELKEPITIAVRAVVNVVSSTISSGISSLLGGTAGSALGNLSIGGTSLAAIGAQAQAFGAGVVSGFGPLAGMQSSGLATSGAYNMGAAAAPVAGAVGGLAANKLISDGYQINKTLTDLQNVATVAAAFIPGIGPLVALGVGVVSGVANRAFGMKAKEITGEGIVGTLSTQGADVKAFEDWFQKGGWLRSNKSGRNFSKISDSLEEYLNTSLLGLKLTTKNYADALGVDASGLNDVTKAIDINLKGLSPEDRKKKIDEALGGFGDELAKKLGLESYDALQKLGEQVLQQRYDLETQLLELQGKTVELRERERAKIYETNKGLFDQIKALEDQKVANEQAAAAMEKLTSVTTTIVDEINRLRGVSTSSSGLEAQFAILTAQVRSSKDVNVQMAALAQLPEITKGLEQIAASSAVNATDIIIARARLAQSLQDTLGYLPSTASLDSSSMSSSTLSALPSVVTPVGTSVSSTSSNQELLAALVTEVQGLRAEVRADVSHNAKTAKILERVNQDGESLSITTLV